MLSTEPEQDVKDYLLSMAREAIEYRLSRQGRYTPILPAEFPQLEEMAATFVTLKTATDRLRGCIGNLEPREALYLSIAHNAEAAAFKDPRFPMLEASEWPEIKLSISILSAAKLLTVTSEADLKQQLRSGVDGLIIQEGNRSATFLPSVWQELPDMDDFIQHLKQKAGFAPDYWSHSIQCSTYQTFNFC